MATDNKQKVLIRSMSVEELENYLVNSDLNGKIIPKNENTWHQSYDEIYAVQYNNNGIILSNESSTSNLKLFINRNVEYSDPNFVHYTLAKKSNRFVIDNLSNYTNLIMLFRPLIEYKE